MRTCILTDSASDLAAPFTEKAVVLPMSVSFGTTQYRDGVDLSGQAFYEKLIEEDDLPVTSQIPPMQFMEACEKALEDHDAVVIITISSKLSGTWQSACLAASEFGNKVFVVDSESASLGEGILVQRALELADTGMPAEKIALQLDAEKKDIHLIALVDTLEYLQKGGRLSKSAAAIGQLLSIKPVIAVENGEVAVLGKARGSRKGNNLLVQEIEKTSGIDFTRPYMLGYSGLSDTLLQKYIQDSARLWKDQALGLPVSLIGATIGTHTGPGAVGVAFFSKPTDN